MTRITLLMLCRSHIIRPSHSNRLAIGSSDKTLLVDCGHGQETANALLAALTESHLRANAATFLPIESKISVKLPMLCRSHIIRPSHSNRLLEEAATLTFLPVQRASSATDKQSDRRMGAADTTHESEPCS